MSIVNVSDIESVGCVGHLAGLASLATWLVNDPVSHLSSLVGWFCCLAVVNASYLMFWGVTWLAGCLFLGGIFWTRYSGHCFAHLNRNVDTC